MDWIKARNNNEYQKILSMYYSFLFVRHPFERVVSAYRNKIVDGYKPELKFSLSMIKIPLVGITRGIKNKSLAIENIKKRPITFPEFVDYIIKGSKSGVDEHVKNT